MADATAIVSKEDSKDQRNFFSVFWNIFKLPFPKNEPKSEEVTAVTEENEATSEKPDVVRFPRKPLEAPPPLTLEAEEESGKTSNPLILWQVYALGGFLVLRWVWGRWRERKARKGDSDEASDDYHSTVDDSGFY